MQWALYLALVLTSSAVLASSPGKQEGPPGNSWKAEVVQISKENGLKLKLKEMVGSCMFGSSEGAVGQTVFVRTQDSNKYKIGQVIEIWLYPDAKGSLEHPKCS